MLVRTLLVCGVVVLASAYRGDVDSLDWQRLAMRCPVLSCMKQCLHGTILDDRGCNTCICRPEQLMDMGGGLPIQLPTQHVAVPLAQRAVLPLTQPLARLGQPIVPLMNTPTQQSICTDPILVGPCRASVPSWGFDAQIGKCVKFIYGGCQGNKNRFLTQQLCDQSCSQMVSDIQKQKMPSISIGNMKNFITAYLGGSSRCDEPISVGMCQANIPRWGFHAPSGKCVKFNYGGCQGNRNRFLTLQGCNRVCQPSVLPSNSMMRQPRILTAGGQTKPGVCPAPSGLGSICLFDPKVNCLSDQHCPGNQKCCSGGCGLFCKNPLMSQPAELNANTFNVAVQN